MIVGGQFHTAARLLPENDTTNAFEQEVELVLELTQITWDCIMGFSL
jgi:hypothetical protein